MNFTQKELDTLFSESKKGSSKSFEKLSGYVRHISYSYFISKVRQGKIKNSDDADDLANNVYLTFAEQYHKIENLEFWLRRVLFLTFINWYKKNKARRTYELNEAGYIEGKEFNPGDKIDADRIVNVIEKLSGDKQAIIKLRFWEDMKFSEIAEHLNKSEDAVKKMFYRTIEELKGKF
jgi:RNA polymerase sigma-70 factor, ECF subfamily